jgi:hypothetical protein
MVQPSIVLRLVFRSRIVNTQCHMGEFSTGKAWVGWRKLLTSMTGLVDQELLVRHD